MKTGGKRVVLGEGYLAGGTLNFPGMVHPTVLKSGKIRMVPFSDVLFLINRAKVVPFNKETLEHIKSGGKKIRLVAEILEDK